MEIAGQRADLTSIHDREVSELLWENGRVFAQRLTRKTQDSPSFVNVHLMKKRFGTVDSLHDRKDDNLHLNLPRNNSLQDNKHRESWYQTHVNMFLEDDEGNSCDKNLLYPQIVPVNEYENLVVSNRSLVSVGEEQDLGSDRKIEKVNKSVPDDQSEAVRRDGEFTEKKKLMNAEKSMEPRPVASSSFCSRGASNNPIYNNLKRRYHEDTEGSADLSDEEKLENAKDQVPARGGAGTRRKRAAEVHNQSERKRRDKINKKMRALQELIPNCNKVDKASMLDEAIDYLKTLQLQVQMMSMGSRVCMPQMMMIPTGLQQIHALQMAHFSAMGMRMNMGGVGCTPPPSFFIPPIAAATAVPGFAAQPLSPMSLFGAPPLGFFHKPVPVAGSQNAAAVELMGSAKLSNPKDPNHLKEMNNAKPECSKTQPSI